MKLELPSSDISFHKSHLVDFDGHAQACVKKLHSGVMEAGPAWPWKASL